MALALLLATAGSAGAGESLDEICEIAVSFKTAIGYFVYPIGSIGLAFLAIKTYSQGRFPWSPFIALLGGLFAFASTPGIIAFLTAGQGALTCS
jgi:hypothetical protein